jgi:hypothetical protein
MLQCQLNCRGSTLHFFLVFTTKVHSANGHTTRYGVFFFKQQLTFSWVSQVSSARGLHAHIDKQVVVARSDATTAILHNFSVVIASCFRELGGRIKTSASKGRSARFNSHRWWGFSESVRFIQDT